MYLIDTHAHLDFPQFENEIDNVIDRAKKAGVNKIISIGCDKDRAKKTIEIAEKYPDIYAAIGIHPNEINEYSPKDFKIIEDLAKHPKLVAIGECGIDLFRQSKSAFPAQKELFLLHINLAKKINKPVIIHFRDARTKGLQILKEVHDFKFVVHCFSENLEFAQEIINLGGMISFTGIVTFPNAEEVQKAAKEIPLEKIMLETDCPFLAPQKYRGQRCEPAYVKEIAQKIAELKGIAVDKVIEQTTKNAEEFFGV